jgi:hypothetical protein
VIDQPGTYTLHPRTSTRRPGRRSLPDPLAAPALHLPPRVRPRRERHRGRGPQHEGMLISVVNLGRDNYLGSPAYFYTYRRGRPVLPRAGDPGQCLFGKAHGRTEFGPQTEPSSRLPNLLDGGNRISNIREHQGTLTIDLENERGKISGREYTESMLPQIRWTASPTSSPPAAPWTARSSSAASRSRRTTASAGRPPATRRTVTRPTTCATASAYRGHAIPTARQPTTRPCLCPQRAGRPLHARNWW